MADIELVVKISEEDYKKVLDTNNREWDWNNMHSCYEAILGGVPLPKGHGRLIDEEEISLRGIHFETERDHAMMIGHLNSAPTIIEADKAESEKQI